MRVELRSAHRAAATGWAAAAPGPFGWRIGPPALLLALLALLALAGPGLAMAGPASPDVAEGAASAAGSAPAADSSPSVKLAPEAGDYSIFGDMPDLVEEGEAVLSRSTAVLGASEEFARAPIADGRFRLTGPAAPLGRVLLRLYDAEGNSKGSTQFILEPGEIRIERGGYAVGLIARGGPYNRKVIAAWRDGDPYQSILNQYSAAMEARGALEEEDEGYEALKEETIRLYQELMGARREALREIASAEGDPLASLFAIEMGGMGGADALARLAQLEPGIGEFAPLQSLRSRLETGVRMRETAQLVQPGTKASSFSHPGLDGKTYALDDALANNRYVLVEFWASWCGPCRVENPNMKKAYERYREQGFEIFAISLDDDREDWAEASEEDGIPWINTGDLQAYAGPVPALFGVRAIPMNYLLDASGTIVAIGIRGEELDAKLAELFDS